jgi:RsiW-degrading membrane proteinase PrsW (M82 family)
LGASIGLGFAFFENCLIALKSSHPFPILLVRYFTGYLLHASTALIISYGLWKYISTNIKSWLLFCFLSVIVHEIANLIISILI